MFVFLRRIKGKLKDRIIHLLWLILPKKSENIEGVEIRYLVVPGFLIDNAKGMVLHYRKSDKIMIFIKPHSYGRRYTIFHEYCEGSLFNARRTEKQITEAILNKLQITSNINIDELKKEAESLLEKLFAFIGEPAKAQETLAKISPEIIVLMLDLIKRVIVGERPRHALSRLMEIELAKKEMSPEDFRSYLYEIMGIIY